MHRSLILLLIAVVIVCQIEGSRKDKIRGKQISKSDQILEDFADEIEHQKEKHADDGIFKPNHKHKEGTKMKHHKKEKFDHKQHLSWLSINKDSDCENKCKHGEVCITGPIDIRPLCVLKKDLKKSMKLFHHFQKKEMKAWKQFQKEYHSDVSHPEYHSTVVKKSGQDEVNIRKHHMGPHDFHQKDKSDQADVKLSTHGKDGEPEECSTSQFSQMRARLMGWFHLLHGQDHLARKAHDGNMKHSYKHVSVKKELRELDGSKCECLKSAMWQFLQMDKDDDDHLSDNEISVLKDNSLEPCMQPFLTSCDHNADGKFSSNEWCCCFSNIVAPCFKKVDEIRRSGAPVTYMPRCDKEGYYMKEQCSGDSEDSYKCWCVDYNGNEYKETRTHGRAHCSKIMLYGKDKPQLT